MRKTTNPVMLKAEPLSLVHLFRLLKLQYLGFIDLSFLVVDSGTAAENNTAPRPGNPASIDVQGS